DEGAAEWRERFARRYYAPVLAFMSVLTRGSGQAADLTQAFFAEVVVTGRLFRCYKRSAGSFSPYLKQSLRNYVRSAAGRHDVASAAEMLDDSTAGQKCPKLRAMRVSSRRSAPF